MFAKKTQRKTVAKKFILYPGVPVAELSRSRLKQVFSSELGVAPSPQVLEILMYACGLIPGRALISTENPNFEMASCHKSI